MWESNILFSESVGGVEASDSSTGKPEVCMLISRREERELAKCSSVKEEGGLVSLPFGNRHNVAARGLGVLVEAAQVGLVLPAFVLETFFVTYSDRMFAN